MKNTFKGMDQVNRLREIQALRRLSPHNNIIKLLEVLYDKSTGRLALVFELMERNIYELIKGRRQHLPEEKIKKYMYQLVKAIYHMHKNGIFHRDIKPENILIIDDTLKLADFGSCRGIYSKQPFTEYISTRWYRAPECLLTDGYYNYKMDIWGVGCVFFEIVSLYPLFPGNNELDQIHKIHKIVGTPPPELLAKLKKHSSQHISFDFPETEGTGIVKMLPHASPECLDLMHKMLAYNPDDRITARQALQHPYFRDLRMAERRMKSARKVPRPLSLDGSPEPGPDGDEDDVVSTSTASNSKNAKPQIKPKPNNDAPSSLLPSITKKDSMRKAATDQPIDSNSDSSTLKVSLPSVISTDKPFGASDEEDNGKPHLKQLPKGANNMGMPLKLPQKKQQPLKGIKDVNGLHGPVVGHLGHPSPYLQPLSKQSTQQQHNGLRSDNTLIISSDNSSSAAVR
eukprot:GEZU01025886.1.p1 GENE.GEZU01025886.1~~GEZU01025886.1.p1  ORF type:complete len:456 (+),score=56.72 GEZU01025886.1:193-1560(+)